MSVISSNDVLNFAVNVREFIEEDFAITYLSGNLRDTTKVYKVNNNSFVVHIPAKVYNINLYRKKGIIVYGDNAHKTNYSKDLKSYKPLHQGSYAEAVNTSGGFSKKHKNYVERALDKALSVLQSELRGKNVEVKIKK